MDSLIKINENIYLHQSDIDILNKYNIDYKNCNTMKELIFKIEMYLNNNEVIDLDELSIKLSEFDYYNYSNK